MEDEISLNESVLIQSNWVDDWLGVKIIELGEGSLPSQLIERFFKVLDIKKIPYSSVRNPVKSKWIVEIGDYTCIIRALCTKRNYKNCNVVFIQGWIPELELLGCDGTYHYNKFITKEDLTRLKNETLEKLENEYDITTFKDLSIYNDESKVSIGLRYHGCKIKEIPAKYLLDNQFKSEDQDFLNYIKLNLNRLHGRYRMELQSKRTMLSDIPTFICSKKTFPTKKMALDAILKRPTKKKKPIRAYECKRCSGWHLTSKTYEEYLENVEKYNQKNDKPKAGDEELAGVPVAID